MSFIVTNGEYNNSLGFTTEERTIVGVLISISSKLVDYLFSKFISI